jgi:hypothetical protein
MGPDREEEVDSRDSPVAPLIRGVAAQAGRLRIGEVIPPTTSTAVEPIGIHEKRWVIEPWVNDFEPLLGLGQYQNRP